ncbi:type II toxin-antitoxin system Phd/YefM family antitoxin [Treponema sp. HNW]|uniref:type II toxin-antitoxin system Phd/YefM family antitoxin n=1 Tax=unclassified Treponema TaxID=2638727 RepID=UPI003D0ADD29
MNALKPVNILDSIIPIGRFNKGEAHKIFSEVKKKGLRIVVKNNVPECILISPRDYQNILDDYENLLLLTEAQKRETDNAVPISQEEILKKYNISQSDLDDIDVELD